MMSVNLKTPKPPNPLRFATGRWGPDPASWRRLVFLEGPRAGVQDFLAIQAGPLCFDIDVLLVTGLEFWGKLTASTVRYSTVALFRVGVVGDAGLLLARPGSFRPVRHVV